MTNEEREYLENLDLDELEDDYVQEYIIVLQNGIEVRAYEDYALTKEMGLLGRFRKAKLDDIIEIKNSFHSDYIPKRSILYISTGEVSKAEYPYKIAKKVRL